jgi:hypothetical protein
VVTVSSTGATLFKNSADSANAFQVQNFGVRNILNIDTTNSLIQVGNTTDGAQITLGATGNANSTIRKTMVVNGTVNANDLVEIDTANAGQVKQAGASSTKVFGIASSAVGSGASQDIVVYGIYQVNADTAAVSIGDLMVTSATAV